MNVQKILYGIFVLFGLGIARYINASVVRAKLIPAFTSFVNGSTSLIAIDTQTLIVGRYDLLYNIINICIYSCFFLTIVYILFQAFKKEAEESIIV